MRGTWERLRRSLAAGAAPREALPPAGSGGLPEGLREVEEEGGTFLVREEVFPPGHLHGRFPLGLVDAAAGKSLARLARDPALAEVDLRRALFLDTETTGLGGVGAVVFLTGLCFRAPTGAFVLRQVFLGRFAHEPPALRHVARLCAQASVLVSFGGKSFDRHRLADRMDLHRVPHALRAQQHLDLLHASRRVHRSHLPDGRLRTIEERVLGVRRRDDLPGSLCPQVYLDWIRGSPAPLRRVFTHNHLDVLSLVTLAAHLARDPRTLPPSDPWTAPLLAAHARLA